VPRQTGFKQDLCADMHGFSLHAAVRCGADDRQALEQLCRYITRPASGLAPRVAGIGCARGFPGRGKAAESSG
jgi:hypothetical protein